ncbi:hypothetical protein HDV00_003791 [Rhizophlyctis rosea]|nr:hypothetical protein HDV00_003791 [Rhizophlyctis rosea]
MKSLYLVGCLLALLALLSTPVDSLSHKAEMLKNLALEEQNGIKCTDRWCGCHQGYCWKNMTGLDVFPSDVVWSPYRFCYKDKHCLMGCVKKAKATVGTCMVLDDGFPPETATSILCSQDSDCFTYREKLYPDEVVKRVKREVTLDDDTKGRMEAVLRALAAAGN